MSGSKCRSCGGPAVIDLPRHNAKFCREHLEEFCRRQMTRAIDDFGMLAPGDRVLVAVSGGKDSLAVWDMLDEAGYEADGLYVGLGIGEYSDASGDHVRRFADQRGLHLTTVDLREEFGYDVPTASAATRRVPCSACGLSKRHLFDRAARDGGYDVLVTGHNLDDEAAVLMGNVLHWHHRLSRPADAPAAGPAAGFPQARRSRWSASPSARPPPTACVRGIDYLVDECPMAVGNKHLAYKAALNDDRGATHPERSTTFYFRLPRPHGRRTVLEPVMPTQQPQRATLSACDQRCGAPTTNNDDAVRSARLVATASAHRSGADRDRRRWAAAAAMSVRRMNRSGASPEVSAAGEKPAAPDRLARRRRYLIDLERRGRVPLATPASSLTDDLSSVKPEGVDLPVEPGDPCSSSIRPTHRPTTCVKMPRGAQVDVPQGHRADPACSGRHRARRARVLEIGPRIGRVVHRRCSATGAHITGYEIRDDFEANRARENVAPIPRARGGARALRHPRSVTSYAGHRSRARHRSTRIVLDLPEPWQVVPHAENVTAALAASSSSPTRRAIIQVGTAPRGVRRSSRFGMAETMEVMHRGWHVDGQAVRPDHRMVAHTGFLSVARFLGRP